MKYIKKFNESLVEYHNTPISQDDYYDIRQSSLEMSKYEISIIRDLAAKYGRTIRNIMHGKRILIEGSKIKYEICKVNTEDDWYVVRKNHDSVSPYYKCDTLEGVSKLIGDELIKTTGKLFDPQEFLNKKKDDRHNKELKNSLNSTINGLNYEYTKIVNDFVSKLISNKDIKVNESKSEYNNLNIMSTTFESLVKSNVEFEESEFKKIMDFFAKYRIIINKYDRNHKIVANGHNRYYSIFKLEDDWFLIKLHKPVRNDETTYKKCDSLDGVFSEVEKEFIEISKVNPDNFIKSVKNYRDNTQLKNKVISKVNRLTTENIQKVIDFINGLD